MVKWGGGGFPKCKPVFAFAYMRRHLLPILQVSLLLLINLHQGISKKIRAHTEGILPSPQLLRVIHSQTRCSPPPLYAISFSEICPTMSAERKEDLQYHETMNDVEGEDIENMDTLKLNLGSRNGDSESKSKLGVSDVGSGSGSDTGIAAGIATSAAVSVASSAAASVEADKDKDSNEEKKEFKNYANDNSKKILQSHVDQYFKKLDEYKSNPKCKIDPKIHLEKTEEVENYVIKEKICISTYYQYIDVYENAINVDEDIEKEEVEFVEIPKYVTKYKPKVVTNYIEKTIEVPSGEEIKQPKYNRVNIPYVIPNVIENEIFVVLKKIIQPEIVVTNEVIEIEVEKYVPRLVPVNVYVPRYFGISAKVKEEVENSVKHVDLTQEQIDYLMKELNPHLGELKVFNERQIRRMDECIKESQLQAQNHNFEPPKPELITYDENGQCETYDYGEFHRFEESCAKQLVH
ncbi:conserved Plasmodium protein, unknown function [Plasmodium ovale wallikeri]|uniref:PhIL1 interacting protein PIP2 n=2 Tax=Plasmodium ovale TaxID=36330 RepID=A0A1A8ZP46_PLAOA|nr:conserved Plasmodium protein, unknown function [Plasmodium ovale wallikeri]